jgi:hypothetical protein
MTTHTTTAPAPGAFSIPHNLILPDEIRHSLNDDAALIVSVSGGKDSDAMALTLYHARQHFGWRGRFIICHADLGRMEWPQTLPQVWAEIGYTLDELRAIEHFPCARRF